jgi:D-alanyl-D-alanine endopeptidase (penicillin-binding protein 7)
MVFGRGKMVAAVVLGGCLLGAWAREIQDPSRLALRSASALVQDQRTGEILMQKQTETAQPIASITKLMTAMVVLDARQDLREPITILEEDKDQLRHSRSRLPVGTTLTRGEALLLALMASENRAAHALGRTYPGGLGAFVAAMNAKAGALGLATARFQDPAGLSGGNVASARDLARIVDQAYRYQEIRTCSTTDETTIQGRYRPILFHNTNRLLQSTRWQIGLSKTGYIDESGQCLVMQAQMKERPVLIVLLDSQGKGSRFGDANRIRQWLDGTDEPAPRRLAKVAKLRKNPKMVKVAQVRRQAKAAHPAKTRRHRRGQA